MVKKIVVSSLFLLILAACYTYYWYEQRPNPHLIIGQVIAPKITPNDKALVPDTLSIDFGLITNGLLTPKPVAPLSLIGKTVTDGITLTPAMPGEWMWETDSHLVFTPKKDWPAEQTYKIKFAKAAFSKQAKMASYHYTFSTLPLELAITEFKFYQDPANPSLREAVATITFSYPINAQSLQDHIALAWQAPRAAIRYTLSFDEHKRTAYLRSEPLAIPEKERFIELAITKGVEAAEGRAVTKNAETASVRVPDAASYFKVSQVAATIVRNAKNQPEQVLTLETTLGATETELNQALHAYVLPAHPLPGPLPQAGEGITSHNPEGNSSQEWRNPGEVTQATLTTAKPLALTPIPAEHEYATLHSYRFNAAPGSVIYLKLDKGTHGFANFVLANDYAALLKAPAYPKEISFLHQGALLALGTEEKLSVLVRGVPAVKFSIARILPDDINHLVTQTEGEFNNPYFINASFNQDNISEIFTKVQSFDASDPAKLQYTVLDLSQFKAATTKNPHPLGLFLLQAQGYDPVKKYDLDIKTNRLILITDLGLIAKDNADGTHDVFIESIKDGTPLKNITVSILGKNGLPILTRTTDANGRANFPSVDDFKADQEPVAYLAKNNNDLAFMPFHRADRQLNYSRFDVGGSNINNQQQTPLLAYIFSDRGIYRPGDVTHVAMIVKQAYMTAALAGIPLQATIMDPRGVTVKDEKLNLNDSGFFTLDFKSTASSPTGQYLVNLYIVKDHEASNLIGSSTFTVAEFLPDQLRIRANFIPTLAAGWLSPKEVHAKVSLANLYGTPAANHKINAKLLLTPRAISFKAFPDYIFMDPLLNPKSPPTVLTDTLNPTETNAEGVASFDLNLERYKAATYQLTVFIEGFAKEGGRSVSTEISTLVSPLSSLVGYKPDGDLHYVLQNSTRKVHLLAIDPALKSIALANLTMKLSKEEPVTTLIKLPNGTFQYQSIIQSKEIATKPMAISATGLDEVISTQEIGDYLVSILDANGTEISRFNYKVVGTGNAALPQNAELNVTLNKAEFAPNEEIKMQLSVPYAGSGLITIERDKVYAAKWFKTSTTASEESIQIPSDLVGNAYVNVALVRDLNSPDIYKNPLSYNVQAFAISHKAHDIAVTLNAAALAKPGETLLISYQTDQPSKMIVFAVDEGVLQVSQYKTPDPLAFFFQKQALEVTTQQLLDQILPSYIAARELAAIGGGEGETAAMLKANLNPFKRQTELPVVFWSGIIDSDKTARQLTYQIPDYFNGELRIMAVAVSASAAGSTSTTTTVRGDFVISPNVPTFVAPNDEFEVTASIANNIKNSGKDAQINVELLVPAALQIKDTAKQTLAIPEGEERSVHYRLQAKALLGSATLQFVSSNKESSAHLNATLSVRPLMPYQTNIVGGHANKAVTLPINQHFYPEFYNIAAYRSTSPLLLVKGLEAYLNQYPYGCTEQLVSKSFPLLALPNASDKIQQMIQLLSERQMSNGGFDYWPGVLPTETNEFASIYAMHFLTEAKAHGYLVPNDIFASGLGYLKEIAGRNSMDLVHARDSAYAIYLLTRNEIITTNYVTHLQLDLDKDKNLHELWQKDITSAYLAATYQLLKSQAEAERLIAYFQPLDEEPKYDSDFYSAGIANAEYLYLLAQHFPNRLQDVNDAVLMSLVNTLNNDNLNTLLASYASLALQAYGQTANTAVPQPDTISIDGTKDRISFQPLDKQIYFYQLVQSGFNMQLPSHATSQGLEVVREFRDANNNATTTTKLGNELSVYLRIRSSDGQYHDNVVVVDLLPGGFEVVRDSVKNLNMDYADVREDRVLFFGSVGPESKEIIYRIKATNVGEFSVPPIMATSMYHPLIKAMGLASHMQITAGQ